MKKIFATCLIITSLSGCASVKNTDRKPEEVNKVSETTNDVETIAVDNSDDAYVTVNSDSDFAPPHGSAANPPANSAGERRLILAYSDDGIHFESTEKILTDQANVPDVIIESDGTLHIYYIGQSIEKGKGENTVRATSKDNGETWTFEKLTYKNLPQPLDPSDPDIVLLDDGTYRLYYTSGFGDHLGIVYAESDDGITFTYKGVSLENTDGKDAVDSNTFFFDGLWHMFVLQEKVQGQLHATSEDGKTFTLVSEDNLRLPKDGYIINNPVIEGDALRMFGFNLQIKNIRSFTTSDVKTWVADDIALDGTEETTLGTDYIQDSAIAKLNDGRYIMIYVSGL